MKLFYSWQGIVIIGIVILFIITIQVRMNIIISMVVATTAMVKWTNGYAMIDATNCVTLFALPLTG